MSDRTLELQIKIAAEEAARLVKSVKSELKALADEAGKYAKTDGAALNNSFKEAESASKDAVSGITEIKKAIGNLAEVAVAAKALSFIKDMGAFALKTADDFQTMKNQFGILLGDMQVGAGLFNEIKAFGDITPFDLDTLTQATNVLISAKVPISDLQKQLTKFGDLSQGNSQRLTSYINAFSQASAKGKADMQILNTYLNQGVPILDALAKNFNVTTAEIVEMSSKGQISFKEFSRALDDLTAAGGQYFGGMQLASESLASMKEGLSEAVNTLSASFGEMLMPVAIEVIEMLTTMTNLINGSPILKGLFAAAIVTLAGYLSLLAVRASIAFAAKMKLNFAIGATNAPVLAATLAVAGLAAGYTVYAANVQQAARAAENMARRQAAIKSETEYTTEAVLRYTQAAQNASNEILRIEIDELSYIVARDGLRSTSLEARQLAVAVQELGNRRTSFIDSLFSNTDEGKLQRINEQLAMARGFLRDPDLPNNDRSKLNTIIQNLNNDLTRLRNGVTATTKTWQQWLGEITRIDPRQFASNGARAAELYTEAVTRGLNAQESISEALGEQFDIAGALRNKQNEVQNALIELLSIDPFQTTSTFDLTSNAVQGLINEYKRLNEEASKAEFNQTIEDLNKKIKELGKSERQLAYEAELARIGLDAQSDAAFKLGLAMDKLTVEEILAGLRNEVQELGQSQYDLARATMVAANATQKQLKEFDELVEKLEKTKFNFKDFFKDLSMQIANTSLSSLNDELNTLGRAFAQGELAAENLTQALTNMAKQILNQLPMMFLQAGLQLIAQGQWAMGLGFITAAGTSSFISGYVDGMNKHAQGGVYNEYGQVAREYAAGGAFTNQIVRAPTYFAHGGGFGLMGEAGPEAIMPLTRMPNGNLGVQTAGTGTQVNVKIINYSGTEVHKNERTDSEGNKEIEVIIGQLVNNHIASGKADKAMARYGNRPVGV